MGYKRGYATVIFLFILLVGLLVAIAVVGVRTYLPSEAAALLRKLPQFPTYQKCVNNACTVVDGIGFNSCKLDNDCLTSP